MGPAVFIARLHDAVSVGDKFPAELSGGMTKRVALARALALDPAIVFIDEPTSGLDPIAAGDFDVLIKTLQKTLGLTVFMVTHDLASLNTVCDRVAALADGRIVAIGPMHDLLLSGPDDRRRIIAGAKDHLRPARADGFCCAGEDHQRAACDSRTHGGGDAGDPAHAVLPGEAQWADSIPKLLQARLIESFENYDITHAPVRAADGVQNDGQLVIDIRRFQIATDGDPAADIALSARILDKDGKVVASRLFQQSRKLDKIEPAAAAAAFSEAFGRMAKDLIGWTVEAQ
jgi:ABC-type sulfate/molybdate transport systems ATPase subunit